MQNNVITKVQAMTRIMYSEMMLKRLHAKGKVFFQILIGLKFSQLAEPHESTKLFVVFPGGN